MSVFGQNTIKSVGTRGIWGSIAAFWGFLWSIFNKYTITVFFLLIIFLNSVNIAIEEETPVPVITEVGLSVLNADHLVFEEVQRLKTEERPIWERAEDGLFRILGNFFSFLWSWIVLIGVLVGKCWFIYIFILIVYKIIGSTNTSAKARNILITLLVVSLIWMFTSGIILIDQLVTGKIALEVSPDLPYYSRLGQYFLRVLPFKGVVSLLIYLFSLVPGISNFLSNKGWV